jgi:hypothetical protein
MLCFVRRVKKYVLYIQIVIICKYKNVMYFCLFVRTFLNVIDLMSSKHDHLDTNLLPRCIVNITVIIIIMMIIMATVFEHIIF